VVIFDMDGTLLDTSGGILSSVRYAISELGYEEPPIERLLRFIGPPIQDSFAAEFGVDEREAQRAANVFRDYYKSNELMNAILYDGVIWLLRALRDRGYRMGIATYKREDYARMIADGFGLAEYCEIVNGADDLNRFKKADILARTAKDLGISDPGLAVYVGDMESDANSAISAGMDFIGVLYGFGFKLASDLDDLEHVFVATKANEILDGLRAVTGATEDYAE